MLLDVTKVMVGITRVQGAFRDEEAATDDLGFGELPSEIVLERCGIREDEAPKVGVHEYLLPGPALFVPSVDRDGVVEVE
ncbi:hypothetical protein D3C86_1078540 [compost metagenome]